MPASPFGSRGQTGGFRCRKRPVLNGRREGRSVSRPQLRVGDGHVIAFAETEQRDAETFGPYSAAASMARAKELYACR